MKNKKILLVVVLVVAALAACCVLFFANQPKDTYDYAANLPGSYTGYHWFYDTKNGESGFYDEGKEAQFCFGKDGSFEAFGGLMAEGENQAGTYTFTGANTIKVTLTDGTYDEYLLRYSSEHDTVEMTNIATKYAVSLEKAE